MIYLHTLLEIRPSATVIYLHHSSLLRLLFVKQLQRVGPIFSKKHNKRDKQIQITNFSRACYARAIWGSFQHL